MGELVASYRLQLRPGFGFSEVERLLPYLSRLGVSHLYLSPLTEARRGSEHGYDVIDHNRVREELGGEHALFALLGRCVEHGLELVVDFVPNHAGVGSRNVRWQDVLAYGPHSPYADYFDIDWSPRKPELQGKLLLPFLGRPYGDVLDGGELSLVCEGGRISAAYFDHRFALGPAGYLAVLEKLLGLLERTDAYWEIKELHDAYTEVRPHQRERAEALRERLTAGADGLPLTEALAGFSGAELHEVLELQCWRLSYWKTAGHEINYRRFFDINDLVALRVENDAVFFETHRLLGRLVREEGIAGVRIDHIDGLNDPHRYLHRLRELGARNIWVEKILAPKETLPRDWPVDGSTGYEFLNDVTRLLNLPEAEPVLDRLYRRYGGGGRSYDEVVYHSKRVVMTTTLSGELSRLAYGLDRMSEADYHTRDFSLEALREALSEVVAAIGRYRTYLPHEPERAGAVIREAIHLARRRNRGAELSVYDFIERLLLEPREDQLEPQRRVWVERFQQYTAPVMAKGVEDTAFYRYGLLLALNDVGGEPDRFSIEPEAFHSRARFRALRYPRALITTATHDHKRGEDTRMRLVALAELTGEWRRALRALERATRRLRGKLGPSAADAYLLYQTLVALWEPDAARRRAELTQRLSTYMEKAVREAKIHSGWLSPDESYEADLHRFIRGVVSDRWVARALGPLAEHVAQLGFTNSIVQQLLKLTAPGVPDIYQGCELIDLSLVDPDNRGPVDFARRQQLLDEIEPVLESPTVEKLRAWWDARDERLKLYVVVCLLRARRRSPALHSGDYAPLDVVGPGSRYVIATLRQEADGDQVAVIARRFPATLAGQAGALEATRVSVPPGRWVELLTGRELDSEGEIRIDALPLALGALRRQ